MKVYMVEGYNLVTGMQNIIDYVEAKTEAEAYEKFEKMNPECEANDILMEYTEEDFENAKEIAYENLEKQSEGVENLVGFEFDGIYIVNPWVDETGRFDLTDEEAVELYGLENVLKFVCDIIEC